MKRMKTVALVSGAVSLAAGLLMAGPSGEIVGPVVGQAVQHDVSRPLREINLPPVVRTGIGIEVPLRPTPERSGRPDRSEGEDQLRQSSARPFAESALTPQPFLSFEGLSDDDNSATVGFRVVPPDTQGDIGPNHYVQWINSIYSVWNITRDAQGAPTGATQASGFPKAGNAIFQGFGGPCETNNDGDPIVLYDHIADRWMLSQFSINQGVQCIAVSTGPNPTGSYYRWAFTVSPGQNNDYPKFGMMPNAYYLSLRDFPSNDGDFASAVAFDRNAMLSGAPNPVFIKFSMPCLSGNCPDGIQPPHLEGPAPAANTPGVFSRAWDVAADGAVIPSDGYRLWRFTPDFASPGSSTFTELPAVLSVSGFDSTMCGFFQRGCIPQPKRGGGERLDPVDELQMYRAQYRHFSGYDSLLISTTVDATGNNVAGMRWAELRNSGGAWTLRQEGTYAPADGENRWMGSIAMNGSGDIALGYSLASNNTFPSIRYVTRQPGDPLGSLPGGEVELVAGSGAQTSSSNRWGDYSAMSVDPVDDCTFWYTQEYYANTNSFDFKTRIGAFPGPSCGGPGCTPTEPTEVSCGDSLDNDCDGLIDCADTDCVGNPVCGGGCTLGQPGDSCTNDSDCCSNSCKGKPGQKTCR